ncbi:MAG: hypothetical protein IJR35_06100, partial [Synergistaceae bacterium]|nr:hypothetical protein [Synergistaceae bacterium]
LSLSDCGNVSELDLTGCVNLEDLSFDGNAIKRFDGRNFPKLRQSKKLNAYGQKVRDIKFTRRFSFVDFFMNLLFNSQVSVSDISVNVSAESGDKNVKNIIARDSSGSKIATTSAYDPATGEVTFAETPASIEYEYDTGIDSPDSMDVSISGEGVEESNPLYGGSSGGCSTGFASLALLIMAGFVLKKK